MSLAITMAIALVIYCHLASLAKRGHPIVAPLTVFYLGCCQIWLVQAAENWAGTELLYGAEAISAALFMALVGIIAVMAGYEATGAWFPETAGRAASYNAGRLWTFAAILVFAGFALNLYSVFEGGGPSAWAASEERRGINVESGYVRLLGNLLSPGLAIMIAASRPRTAGWYLSVGLGALTLIFYIYAGTRSRSLMLAFMLLGGIAISTRRRVPVYIIAATFFVGSVMSSYLRDNRASFSGMGASGVVNNFLGQIGGGVEQILFGSSEVKPIEISYGDEFTLSVGTISVVPDRVPYGPAALTEFFTRPVPAGLWSGGKPYPYYENATRLFEETNATQNWYMGGRVPVLTGPALGFIANYYFIGGWLAVIIFGLATGFIFRLVCNASSLRGESIVAICLAPIGFNEAVATPLFWLFELPTFVLVILIIIAARRDVPTKVNGRVRGSG